MRCPVRNDVQSSKRIGRDVLPDFNSYRTVTVHAVAVGWGAQRLFPENTASVQHDSDGTPMISDVLPDEFYLAMARSDVRNRRREEGKTL
jgi:hypothetical protein